MEVNANKSVKKKLPTTLIIGAVLIVVSLALVFVLGFLPDIKTKKAFYGKVETLSESGNVHQYILQRINTNVFPDVDALMHNFQLTTEHLSSRLQMPGKHGRGIAQRLRRQRPHDKSNS